MKSLEIIYLLAAFGSVVAMAPQIRQLLKSKHSDELNLVTWVMWSLTQCIALAYSVAIGAIPYLIANIAWVIFYIVMITLIIKYKSPKHRPVAFDYIDTVSLDERLPLASR